MSEEPFRIGAVSFLNAVPLVYDLENRPDEAIIIRTPPSQLPALLDEGRIDAGLIPLIEYFRGCGESIVRNIALAADGPVRSVKLYGRKPFNAVDSVALDTSSRSSVALTKIMMRYRFERDPKFINMPPDLNAMLKTADAALLIGDSCLEADETGLNVLDLAAEWKSMTACPFVFAAWVMRPGIDAPRLAALLTSAKQVGLKSVDRIAEKYAGLSGQSEADVRSYLTRCMDYDFTKRHERGAEQFRHMAFQCGLLDQEREMVFVDPARNED